MKDDEKAPINDKTISQRDNAITGEVVEKKDRENNDISKEKPLDSKYFDKYKDFIQNKKITKVSGKTTPSVKGLANILDALLSKELISVDQYNAIKFESVSTNKSFEDLIIEQGLVGPKEIVKTLAEMKGIEFVDLKDIEIPVETLNLIPSSVASGSAAVAIQSTPYKVKVVMKDPLDLQKIKYLESIIGKKIDAVYGYEDEIKNIIDTKYGAQLDKELGEALEEVGGNLIDVKNYGENEITDDQNSAPIIKIVNMMLDYGIKNKASDIHIEPREKKVVVRFRIRGILYEKLSIPRQLLPSIITRIKILSGLKIDEHRIPQDGRFQAKSQERIIDLRVSVMPSIYGEKVVMRLLEKTQGIMSLEELGLRGTAIQRLKESLKKTQGIILVTGPTGSGKTQTLASCQKILNSPDVNILTLEDPVEIRIDGVTQVQVNPEVGLTFATGLRSFLRQDPDIIMVGEIRDSETASLAVQSALVGRLVLSTVHTNSAAGAFIRLMDMGVESFLLSSTVNLLLGQRLVRVLCECKEAYTAPQEAIEELHTELDMLGEFKILDDNNKEILTFNKDSNNITLYKPVGCPKCGGSGYISRTGIFEALKMSESIGRAILNKTTINEIQDIAIREGMIRMVQDGYIKAIQGVTTLEEIIRVKNE